MSIAPIVCKVTVNASPERAFKIFTSQITAWWPSDKTVGAKPPVAIVIEPKVGGRWFERDADGTETNWGKVLTWEPPSRTILGWQLNSRFEYDSSFLTELELTFTPTEGDKTLVVLEHRNLERYGADAERLKGQLGGGWPTFLSRFAAAAENS
jgi:uncharacterized protein YndB with AHSA1/START domain